MLRLADMLRPATTANGCVVIILFWLIRGLDNGAKYNYRARHKDLISTWFYKATG
jgi:hypothetical protein